jgi:hypothetical protein
MVPFVSIALKMHASQQGPTLVVFVLGPASFVPASVTGIEMRVRNDVRCSVAAARASVARFDTSEPRPGRALATSSRGRFSWKIATINEAFYQRGHIGKITRLDLSLAQWHTADSPTGSTAGVQGWASLSTSDVLKNPSMG